MPGGVLHRSASRHRATARHVGHQARVEHHGKSGTCGDKNHGKRQTADGEIFSCFDHRGNNLSKISKPSKEILIDRTCRPRCGPKNGRFLRFHWRSILPEQSKRDNSCHRFIRMDGASVEQYSGRRTPHRGWSYHRIFDIPLFSPRLTPSRTRYGNCNIGPIRSSRPGW
jgi:hypothetical protein